MESKDVSKVDGALLDQVEADVYWCLTKLLDNIQVRWRRVRRAVVAAAAAVEPSERLTRRKEMQRQRGFVLVLGDMVDVVAYYPRIDGVVSS